MAEINVSMQLDDEYSLKMQKALDDFIAYNSEFIKDIDNLEELATTTEKSISSYVVDEQQATVDVVTISEKATEQINDSFKIALAEAGAIREHTTTYREINKYKDWVVNNIDIQKSIPKAYSDNINKIVSDINSQVAKELGEKIGTDTVNNFINENLQKFTEEALKKGEEVTIQKLDFWARDQVGNFTAEQTEGLFKQYTLESYIWETQGDNRVREVHASLQGMIIKFGESPIGVNPGQEYACRCGYSINEREISQKNI